MKLILSIAFVACSSIVFSQNNFIPGYIVTQQGDTLRGFIDYQSSAKSAFDFRTSADGETKAYGTSDIVGFGIVDGKSFKVKELPFGSGRSTVFAEVLVRGRANLYRYENNFFIEKDTVLRALTQSTRDVANKPGEKQGQYQLVQKQYAGILNVLFLDCQGMSNDVMNVKLSERDLTRITTRYNRCKGESVEATKSGVPSFRVDFTAFAGYDVTSFSFTTTNFQSIRNPESKDVSSGPAIGIGAAFSNPREAERLFATVDVQFSQMTFNQTSQTFLGTTYYDEEYTLKFTKLRLPIGIKYILKPGTTTSFYGKVGYAFNTWLNGNIKGSQVVNRPNVTPAREEYDYDLDTFSVGQFLLSLGVQFNKFKLKGFVELRAEAMGGKGNAVIREPHGYGIIDAKSVGIQTFSLNAGVLF